MTGTAIMIWSPHQPNHNPGFASVIHSTLQTGVVAMVVAAPAWLVAYGVPWWFIETFVMRRDGQCR